MQRVMVSPASTGLQITTPSLTGATVGSAYSFPMSASGGLGPYAWSITSNSPNYGLWLGITGAGTLFGTPQFPETESVTIMVTDARGSQASLPFSLTVSNSGALAIASGGTLPTGTVNGPYYFQLIAQGGSPPYQWSMGTATGTTNWNITFDGWLLGMPTAAETDTFTVTVTDAANSSTSLSCSVTHTTALRITTADPTTGVFQLPPARTGHKYKYTFTNVVQGGTAPYTYSLQSGSLPAGLTMTSGVITGTPTRSGNPTAVLKVTDSAAASVSVNLQMNVSGSSTAARPTGNTGSGFFVSGSKFYDPNGFEFRIRGLDRNHYDSSTWAGPAAGGLTQCNAVRYWMFKTDGTIPVSTYTSGMNTQHIANNQFVIATMPQFPNGVNSTGNTSTANLANGVQWWVTNQSAWAPYFANIAVEVANEWGPSNSTVFQYAYQAIRDGSGNNGIAVTGITRAASAVVTVNSSAVSNPFANSSFACVFGAGGMTQINSQVVPITATGGVAGAWTVTLSIDSSAFSAYSSGGTLCAGVVGILRGANYTCPIFINSGGSGQDEDDFTNYAAAIQASDVQGNCVFCYHLYGASSPNLTAVVGTCPISGITNAASAKISLLNSRSDHHPFATGFPANTFWGTPSVLVSGVNGMTAINGTDPVGSNPLGGAAGAWTVTTQVNSTGFGAYTSGGMCDDYRWYVHRVNRLANLGVCMIIEEFGPGQTLGNALTSINDVIWACEANGLGWVYWAWDDHGSNFSGWFGCTFNTTGAYSVATDLTAPGMEAILHPRYSLGVLATPATSFL